MQDSRNFWFYGMVFRDGLINEMKFIFTPINHGNEIWDKIGFNSACVRDICEIFAFIRGFRGSEKMLLAPL